MIVLWFLITIVIDTQGFVQNGERILKNSPTEKKNDEIESSTGRQIFDYRSNGIRMDFKVVPIKNNSNDETNRDYFPDFPVKDIGRCVAGLSISCVEKRIARFIETIGTLKEITMFGQIVKFVKTKSITGERRSLKSNETEGDIMGKIEDFFDMFVLRLSFPRFNGKPERNQIDFMFDDTAEDVIEGRDGKGGGGGGGCDKKGKGGGGKCKVMMAGMMGGLMIIKLKIILLVAMKGMMMAGMSLMMSTGMLMSKFMKGGGGGGPWQGGGGGPWQGGGGGGPWQGGGGGAPQLKEIVLLTKASGGGGGGGGGGGCCGGGGGGGDSYGAPPPSSYGPPSSSYGAPSGGGGWGRSFEKRQMILQHNKNHDNIGEIRNYDSSASLIRGEFPKNLGDVDYPDYQEYPSQNENSTYAIWNLTESTTQSKYDRVNATLDFNRNNSSGNSYLNFVNYPVNNYSINTNRPDLSYDSNILRPTYVDEWQPTEGKINVNKMIPTNLDIQSNTKEVNHRSSNSYEDAALHGI